jgi:hypothetical protein
MEVRGQHHVLAALPPASNPDTEYLVWRASAFEWPILEKRKSVACVGVGTPSSAARSLVSTATTLFFFFCTLRQVLYKNRY